ncbi:MAG: CBS domain-containing protein [Methanolinea sp.]|nr:CBS domain-containing protein [Methanolinea sp.]
MKTARDFMVEVPVFRDDEKVTRVRSVLREDVNREAFVQDTRGKLLGYVDISDILRVPSTRSDVTIEGFIKEIIPAHTGDSLETVIGLISKNNTDSVPVVDAQGQVIGGVRLADIFPVVTTRHPLRGTVGEFMSRNVVECEAEEPIHRIYNLILESGYSAFPVVKKKRLIGIISRRDLLRDGRWRPSLEGPSKTRVESVMTTPVITVSPGDELQQAASMMVKHDISRLPVVEEEKLVGILDRHDVLKAVPGDV